MELKLEDRRTVFSELVTEQDNGLSVRDARLRVADRHRIDTEVVKSIEREGIEHGWPPLDQ